jgi:hypothetical protein
MKHMMCSALENNLSGILVYERNMHAYAVC